MKKYIYLLLICALCASCKDDIDIEKMMSSPKMVAYCFPSNSDSTFISLSKSSPVKTKKGISGDNTAMINDAKITYKVNGVERDVHLLSNGIYYVKGGNKAGDDIEMTASADNLNSVNASTVIPEAPIMDSVRYKGERERQRRQYGGL
jgi:hypothetical protein